MGYAATTTSPSALWGHKVCEQAELRLARARPARLLGISVKSGVHLQYQFPGIRQATSRGTCRTCRKETRRLRLCDMARRGGEERQGSSMRAHHFLCPNGQIASPSCKADPGFPMHNKRPIHRPQKHLSFLVRRG